MTTLNRFRFTNLQDFLKKSISIKRELTNRRTGIFWSQIKNEIEAINIL